MSPPIDPVTRLRLLNLKNKLERFFAGKDGPPLLEDSDWPDESVLDLNHCRRLPLPSEIYRMSGFELTLLKNRIGELIISMQLRSRELANEHRPTTYL